MRTVFAHICVALFFPLLASCGTYANTSIVKGNYNAVINVQSWGRQISVSPKDAKKSVDIWGILRDYPLSEIVINEDITFSDAPAKDMIIPVFKIDGNGHTIRLGKCPILRNTDLLIKDVVFDCSSAKGNIIYAIGEKDGKQFKAQGCVFVNVPEMTTLCVRRYEKVLIENCRVDGMLSMTSMRKSQYTSQILLYECEGEVVVRNNQIINCFGIGIEGLGFSADDNCHVFIENNRIDSVSNGGIVFTGGEVWNATIRKNRISNTHCLGNQFDNETGGGPNSAINLHGFRNAVVEDNVITSCAKSACFDFDGSVSGGTDVAKGTGLTIQRNNCSNVGVVALFVVKDVTLRNNTMSNSKVGTTELFMMINGSKNVSITDNVFKLYKAQAKRYYPISIKDTKLVDSGRIRIEGNSIDTDSNILVYVDDYFDGDCIIGENIIVGQKKKLSVVNNSKAKVSIPTKGKIVWYK